MPVREIRTRISLDGEKEFKTALADAQRAMRVMGSELKAASAEFEATGNREQLLTTRSKVLRQEIAQQEEIIRSLGLAVSDSAGKYRENSAVTDGYRIKLNNAQAALSRMKKELEDTDREAEELGRDSRRVGIQIKDGIGDAADETKSKLEQMYDAIARDVGNIRGTVTISAVMDIADAVSGVLGTISGIADSTREERRSQAILGFNARQAGLDDERVQKLRAEMAALTGDTDTALEAISNLIATGWDIQNIEFAARAMMGAEFKFPETIQAENLGESIQETVQSGEATGQIVELVDRLLGNTEEFESAIEEAGTAMGRANVILGYLSNSQLETSYNEFISDPETKGVIDALRAEQAVNDQMTELGGHVDELFLTDVKNAAAKALDVINTAVDEGIGAGAAQADRTFFGGWFSRTLGDAQQAADAAAEEIQSVLDAAANTWDAFIQGDFAEAAEASGLAGLWDSLFHPYDTDAERAADEALTPIRNEITELQQQAADVQNEIANMYALGIPENVPALEEQLAGIEAQIADKEAELEATGKKMGVQTMQGMTDGIAQTSGYVVGQAAQTGEQVGIGVGNGIAQTTPYVASMAAEMSDAVLAEVNRMRAGIGGVSEALQSASRMTGEATGSSRGGTVNVNLNVSGRTLAQASVPYINDELGRMAQRNA